MKTRSFALPAGLVIAALLPLTSPLFAAAAAKDSDDTKAPAAAPKAGEAVKAPAAPSAGAADAKPKEKENPLHISAAKRSAAGITLARPTSATLAPEVTAFGRVLDPVPFVTLVAELETARAAATASEKDLARTQALFDAGANASAQTVEAGTAVVARNRTAVASARARLIAGWGRALADSASLATVLDAFEKGQTLARVDLLPGDAPAPDLKTFGVGLLGSDERFDAEVLGPTTSTDPQLQGAGFLVVVKNRTLPVGAALRATVPAPGAPETALSVPRSAIVYHQGSAWIYVLGEDDIFERKLVTPGRSIGDKVMIHGAVEDSEQVVTLGAQQILSAELQAGGAPDEG